MNIQPPGVLERYHHQAIRDNPEYRAQFNADVLREEMMMAMPIVQPRVEEPALEPPMEWQRRQWGYVQQLRAQVNYLNSKLAEHIETTKPKKRADPLAPSKKYKGIDR